MRLDITRLIGSGSTAFTAVERGRRVCESWVLPRVSQSPIHETARETDP